MKSMKKVAGTLKIDQSQFEELESFSKFSSDVDTVTALALDKGRKNNQLLVQPQYSPMPVGEQVAILYCGTHALMKDIKVEQVKEFQDVFLERMRHAHKEDVIKPLSEGIINDDITKIIEEEAASVTKSMIAG